MNRLDNLRVLFNSFFYRKKNDDREMKRVFQLKRYLEWIDLTPEEKISVKRFLLIPIFAYLAIGFFNQNLLENQLESALGYLKAVSIRI